MGRFLNKIFIVSSRVLPIPEIHIVLMQNIWLIFNGAYLFFFFLKQLIGISFIGILLAKLQVSQIILLFFLLLLLAINLAKSI